MSIRSDVVSHPFTAELIRQKARKLCRRPGFSRSDEADISQGMYLYVWERSRLFDPTRGTVEAFVITAVTSWEGMEYRRRRAKKRHDDFHAISLESTMVACDGDVDSLASVLEGRDGVRLAGRDSKSLLNELEIRDEYRLVIAQLTKREQQLFRDISELGVAGTARKRRASRRRIDRLVAQIRERLEGDRSTEDRAPDDASA
jgi:DNA-directed RNA polymerase specialized sigma24 family protein